MTITIDRSLLLFEIPRRLNRREPGRIHMNLPVVPDDPEADEPTRTTTIPPGKYQVEGAGLVNGERWWKLKGKDFGNAVACWEAVRPPCQSLAERVETLCKKAALLVTAIVWGCLLVKTDWAYVPDTPLTNPGRLSVAILQHYSKGETFTVQQVFPGEKLVIRYASGPQIIHEFASGEGAKLMLRQAHIVQVHKDLFLLVMMLALFFPSRRVMLNSFKFLLPLLIFPILGAPDDPTLGASMGAYYFALASALAALVWNNPYSADDEPSKFERSLDAGLGTLATIYNLAVIGLVVYTALSIGRV